MAEFEYDPERAIWRPGRRTFIFMLGGALAGTMLPGEKLYHLPTDRLILTRPKMVDPRMLMRATFMELEGDDRLSRELGLKLMKDNAQLKVERLVGLFGE